MRLRRCVFAFGLLLALTAVAGAPGGARAGADDPAREAPEALETAIRWFMDHPPDDGPVEFPGGSGK